MQKQKHLFFNYLNKNNMTEIPPDYKKPNFLFPITLLVVLITCIAGCYLLLKSEYSKPISLRTENKPPVQYITKRIVLEFADTIDGRPTYNVLLSDTSQFDCMYPEEIANSLNTGTWHYNETLKVQ